MKFKEVEKRWARGYDFSNNEDIIQIQNDVEWLFDQAEKIERYNEEINKLEDCFEDFGKITGDNRSVYIVRKMKEKLNIDM